MFRANCPLYCRNSIRSHTPQICNEHSCWYSTFPDEITPQLCHRNVSQALRFKRIISDYVHKCLRRIWLYFFPHVRDCLLCNTRCRYGQYDFRRPVRVWNILYTFMDYFDIPTPQYSLSYVCQLLSLLGACIKLSFSLENFAYRGFRTAARPTLSWYKSRNIRRTDFLTGKRLDLEVWEFCHSQT